MPWNILKSFRRLKRLPRETSGHALIYVTLSASVLMGMVGLALDGSRLMITHSEAQAAADAAALAAAAQLDGGPDAITRATAAAQGVAPLVSNDHRFAEGATQAPQVAITQIRFLTDLPADDDDPIPNSMVTTDPQAARFVEVTTADLTHANTFLMAVVDAPTKAVRARAVAGLREVYCKIPPLMICNPDEVNPGDPFDAAAHIGAELVAKTQGDSAQWAPGTFGLLQTSACPTPSADCVRDTLAAVTPNVCVENEINVRPGEAAGPASAGMNVRFDIYAAGVKKSATNAPDTNITQDFKQCNKDEVAAGAPFPHDTDSPAPTRIGNGKWDCLSYWTANHTQAAPSWCTSSTGAPYTRYYVYQLEKTAGFQARYGAPKCVTPGVDERRVVYLTVLNCKEHGVKSNSEDVPVEALLKTFLLRPVAQIGAEAEMDLEILEVVTPGSNSDVLKDDVQLYR